jgi:hypothetical protein
MGARAPLPIRHVGGLSSGPTQRMAAPPRALASAFRAIPYGPRERAPCGFWRGTCFATDARRRERMGAARSRRHRPRGESPQTPVVLVLALLAGPADELVVELQSRKDRRIVLAWEPEQAQRLVERLRPALAVATADVPAEWVDAVAAAIQRHRSGTALLAVRDGGAEEPPSWRESGVAVLRCPLVPFALSRSIDVVLKLNEVNP